MLCQLAAFQPVQADEQDNRQAWKRQTISYLKTISPAHSPQTAKIRSRPEANIFEYEIEDEGLIKISATEWIYLKAHSADKDRPGQPKIGDMVLAIDQDGNLYQNDGHVCGGVQLRSRTGREFEGLEDFLETRVFQETWRALKDEESGKDPKEAEDVQP